MKCISDELIQKYIDNEASQEEAAYINEHLLSCAVCRNAVEEQIKLAAEIRDTINLLSEEIVEIPLFNRQMKEKAVNIRAKDEKKKSRIMLRWSLCAASVACILFFMIFMLKPEKDTPIDSATFFYNTENEFDANRSILQQDIVIKMIDSEGNTSEFNL
jgi:Predicted transmembrane transcriptional regulator (anti-sigma factor)